MHLTGKLQNGHDGVHKESIDIQTRDKAKQKLCIVQPFYKNRGGRRLFIFLSVIACILRFRFSPLNCASFTTVQCYVYW